MKKLLLLIIIGGMGIASLYAQSIDQSVFSSSGCYFETAQHNLTWVMGEVMTETFSNSNLYITQGFLQPYNLGTGIDVNNYSSTNISVFPNPATDYFLVEFLAENTISKSQPFLLTIVDINGKVVLKRSISDEVSTIDIQNLNSATYLVQIVNTDLAIKKSIVLQKGNH